MTLFWKTNKRVKSSAVHWGEIDRQTTDDRRPTSKQTQTQTYKHRHIDKRQRRQTETDRHKDKEEKGQRQRQRGVWGHLCENLDEPHHDGVAVEINCLPTC